MYPQPNDDVSEQPTQQYHNLKYCRFTGCNVLMWHRSQHSYCPEHRPFALVKARVSAGLLTDFPRQNHRTQMIGSGWMWKGGAA